MALVGVAEEFAEFFTKDATIPRNLQTLFVAGLWRSRFVQELCWYVGLLDLHDISVDDLPLLAPTWSWASSQRPISAQKRRYWEYRPFATLADVQITYEADWTCQGSTQLVCRLLETRLGDALTGRLVSDRRRAVHIQASGFEQYWTELILDRSRSYSAEYPIFLVALGCHWNVIESWGPLALTAFEGIGIAHSANRAGAFERVGYFLCIDPTLPQYKSSGEGNLFAYLQEHHESDTSRTIIVV